MKKNIPSRFDFWKWLLGGGSGSGGGNA